MVGGCKTNEPIPTVVDQYQRHQITDGEFEFLQHPLTYLDIFPAYMAEALNLLREPYPCDSYCAVLFFMAAMSGVMPLGTAVNHRTDVFPANKYVAPVSVTGITKTSHVEELENILLPFVREKVAFKNSQQLAEYLELRSPKRSSKPQVPLLCGTGDATLKALVIHFVR